jgi:hypothetical protein
LEIDRLTYFEFAAPQDLADCETMVIESDKMLKIARTTHYENFIVRYVFLKKHDDKAKTDDYKKKLLDKHALFSSHLASSTKTQYDASSAVHAVLWKKAKVFLGM